MKRVSEHLNDQGSEMLKTDPLLSMLGGYQKQTEYPNDMTLDGPASGPRRRPRGLRGRRGRRLQDRLCMIV